MTLDDPDYDYTPRPDDSVLVATGLGLGIDWSRAANGYHRGRAANAQEHLMQEIAERLGHDDGDS